MGKTLAAKRFSSQSRTFRSYVEPNGELLHIAHTTKTIYDRPDQLLVSVTGDDGSIKILYDGKTLVLYAAEAKQYVSLPVTGGIDKALDLLEEHTGTDYPFADLLSDDPAGAAASGISLVGAAGQRPTTNRSPITNLPAGRPTHHPAQRTVPTKRCPAIRV
jgi:hypothetical protein